MDTSLESPALALARASLALAGKQAGLIRAERGLDHALALVETTYTFVEHCPEPLEADAQTKLGVFFEVTIGRDLDQGKWSWLGSWKYRSFVLEAAAELGSIASELAGQHGSVVTAAILDEAGLRMVASKEPSCVLPSSLAGRRSRHVPFGEDCQELVKVIKGGPRD